MDILTQMVQEEISKQYRSVRNFALSIGIPQSTIVSSLKNGVGGSSYNTVLKICHELGIDPHCCSNLDDANKQADAVGAAYAVLDEYGKHTVDTVLQVELMRCAGSVGRKTTLDEDGQKQAVKALRKIKRSAKEQ